MKYLASIEAASALAKHHSHRNLSHESCVDGKGTDYYGYGCDYYTENSMACDYGSQYDTEDFSASRDCCACGGGSEEETAASYYDYDMDYDWCEYAKEYYNEECLYFAEYMNDGFYEYDLNYFDSNDDGIIMVDEVKEYFKEMYGTGYDSETAEYLEEYYFSADKNGDGILSRDEYRDKARAIAEEAYCCEFDADGNLITGGDNDWSDWSDDDWSWDDYYGGEDWEWYYDEYDNGNNLDFLDGESWTFGPVTISYDDKASKMAAAAGALILAGITVSA